MAGQVLPGPGRHHQLHVRGDSPHPLLLGHDLHHLQLRIKHFESVVVQLNGGAVPHIGFYQEII